jgi:hypothetical protein
MQKLRQVQKSQKVRKSGKTLLSTNLSNLLISRRQFLPPTGWKAKSCFEAQGWFLLAIGGWKVWLVDLYPVKIIQDMHMPHICMARHLQTTYQHAMSFEQL